MDLLTKHGVSPGRARFRDPRGGIARRGCGQGHHEAFAELGVALALDDFGAGYSNLSWLKDLPITGIKIDRQFIEALNSGDGRGTAIVQGLVNLGHSLQLSVVGEGVETAEQAARIAHHRVRVGPGLLLRGTPYLRMDLERVRLDHPVGTGLHGTTQK